MLSARNSSAGLPAALVPPECVINDASIGATEFILLEGGQHAFYSC